MTYNSIVLSCGDAAIERCHDLALKTLANNTQPFQDGLLTRPEPCILAGAHYNTPWTRDCAYNVWNAGALLDPVASRNTLLSVLMEEDGEIRIGGQYWDAISWVIGAWHHFCLTGERDFLELAHQASAASLDFFERTEFDAKTGLFMGPASYGDGVAAYPEPYCNAGGSSGILDYPAANPQVGKIRMKCLSTNCLYYGAYRRAAWMEEALGLAKRTQEWNVKADTLRGAINKALWLEDQGRYGYFLGNDNERIDDMEGLGQALAVLLKIANPQQAKRLLAAQYVAPHGIPCVWPLYARYADDDGRSFGRHNGTVWPFIQGLWADAALRHGRDDLFEHELLRLTEATDRMENFLEILHPLSGDSYGGLQEDNGVIRLWESCPHQTWSATGYLRMLYLGLFGMRCTQDGILFMPHLTPHFQRVALEGLPYRQATLSVGLEGQGGNLTRVRLNGVEPERPLIPANARGEQNIVLIMGE